MILTMDSLHPHRIRSLVIALSGLVLALASVIGIGLTIRTVTSETLSLAYRIEAKRTVFFVRTTDRTSFAHAIETYAPMYGEKNRIMMPAPPPKLESLRSGVSYEFALLSGTGSAPPQWLIEVQSGNQRHTTIVSTEDPGLFLNVRDIGRSLGRSSALLEGDRNAANLAFIDLSRLPFAGNAATLARSIVLPFKSAVITWNGAQGKLILRKKEKNLFAQNGPTADLLPSPLTPPAVGEVEPLLSMAASNPQSFLASLAQSLLGQDPHLYEGLRGILSAKLDAGTHQTDLTNFTADLLSRPTRLLVTGRKESGLRFVVTGRAKDKQVADQWIEDLRSATIPARIRTQEFSGENSRIDVIAELPAVGEVEPPPEDRTASGWTMATIGSDSGSPFTVAGKGDQIIIGNDADLLRIALHHLDEKAVHGSGPRSLEGTADIAWLTKAAGDLFPFLADDCRSLSEALFGKKIRRIDWSATDGAREIRIHFTQYPNPSKNIE